MIQDKQQTSFMYGSASSLIFGVFCFMGKERMLDNRHIEKLPSNIHHHTP